MATTSLIIKPCCLIGLLRIKQNMSCKSQGYTLYTEMTCVVKHIFVTEYRSSKCHNALANDTIRIKRCSWYPRQPFPKDHDYLLL